MRRFGNESTTGFNVKIEEEIDSPHSAETVGYIAIEPATLKSGSAKVSETKYHPYDVTQEGGGDKYLYTGKEFDKGTGLYYYEARYYNPNVGRFIQADTLIPDPYNPQSLNRYSYVLNNPLRYVDPSGNLPQAKNQMGTLEEFIEFYETKVNNIKEANPDVTNTQILNSFADYYDTYDDKNPPEGSPRYIYTENGGVVDLKHFFGSAVVTSQTGDDYATALGFLGEVQQWRTGSISAFMADDLPSNRYGREILGDAGDFYDLGKFYEWLQYYREKGDKPDIDENSEINSMDMEAIIFSKLVSLGATDSSNYPYYYDLPDTWPGHWGSADKNKRYTSGPISHKGHITEGGFNVEKGCYC